MNILYDPLNYKYKSQCGAVQAKSQLRFCIGVPRSLNVDTVSILIHADYQDVVRYPMTFSGQDADYLYYSYTSSFDKGLYWYNFSLSRGDFYAEVGRDDILQPKLYYGNAPCYQLLVYEQEYATPQWLNNGVMYHIFVDRFCKCGEKFPVRNWGDEPYYDNSGERKIGTDFFGGNIKGIISKLDYLSALNVTVIYLSPIFEAESNHKYDTGDYEKIDSRFGTIKDFKNLCAEADKRGIKIILDGVFNHSGVNGKYFNKAGKYDNVGAWQSTKSAYGDWFKFNNGADDYKSWWGIKSLPTHNCFSQSFAQYLCGSSGIIRKWIKAGAYGWRLDVVDEIFDVLLDKIVSAAKETNPQAAIIGEVWDDATNKISYGIRRKYFQGGQLDSVMNYPLKNAVIDFVRNGNDTALLSVLRETANNFPHFAALNLMNILSSHDTPRAITALADTVYEQGTTRSTLSGKYLSGNAYYYGRQLLKMASALQYTLCGFPSLYYGDEIGMSGYGDPFCRGCFNWDLQDGELLDHYKWLGQLRKMPCFVKGDFCLRPLAPSVVSYTRTYCGQTALCIFNKSQYEYVYRQEKPFYDLKDGTECTEYIIYPNAFALLKLTD